MSKNKLYLAYGSNLNLEQMAHRCPNAKVVGSTGLLGHRLVFRGAREGAVATVEPSKGESVQALVWEITPTDEKALDRYEGWPHLYRKETIDVQLDGKMVQTMVYIMNEGRPLNQPSDYYYSVILDGYKSAGFDVANLKNAVADSFEENDGKSEK